MRIPTVPLTSNPDALDALLHAYKAYNYNLRKAMDESCMDSYGMNVPVMCEVLKHKINTDDPVAIRNVLEAEGVDFSSGDNAVKYEKSAKYQEDPNIVIIDPLKNDDYPDYTLADLEDKYGKYMNLGVNFRRMSDDYSVSIWGYTVYNMYTSMKQKLLVRQSKMKAHTDTDTGITSTPIDSYIKDISEEVSNTSDPVTLLMRKMDCLTEKASVSDKIIIDHTILNMIDNKLTHTSDYDEDIPQITPYFTPDEMEDLTNQEIDPYEYIFDRDQKELHEDIKKAMETFTESHSDIDKQKVIDLGWNPSVPYTWKNQSFARKRIVNWFNENKGIDFIDVANFKEEDEYDIAEAGSVEFADIVPVHIVLLNHDSAVQKVITTFTKSEFGHAGISFDSKLDKIYSFDGNEKKGFSVESVNGYKRTLKNAKIETVTFFVKKSVKDAMEKVVQFYYDHINDTKYDFANLKNFVTKRVKNSDMNLSLICSQFVDMLLKHCHIDLTGKPSNLVYPGDFERPAGNSKMYITYKGPIERFRANIITNRVKALLKKGNEILTTLTTEMVNDLYLERSMMSLKSLQSNDPEMNQVLSEIREWLTPDPIIVEARLLPIRFNQKGDLYIDLPRNLEKEYQESHRLIRSYGTDNIDGIKHELARLFYINSILEDKIRKVKDGDTRYKEYRDLRARVLNDYMYGFKIVADREPNFNFHTYYKNTEYYRKTLKIDRNTMKYSGKMISDFLKSQGI